MLEVAVLQQRQKHRGGAGVAHTVKSGVFDHSDDFVWGASANCSWRPTAFPPVKYFRANELFTTTTRGVDGLVVR